MDKYELKVSLDEIDSMVMDELNVLSVSIGMDDHLTVFVTDALEKDPVSDYINRKIPAARTGFRVLVIPEFPRNEGGKILYAELQAVAEL